MNFVMSMPNHPKYVLKSSSSGLYQEVSRFRKDQPYGLNYNATNCEGGVSPCLFSLAERVAFSNHLRHIIRQDHLTMIKVPKKVLASFPSSLIPFGATPLHNKRVFVISKRYEINFDAPMILDEWEQIELIRQLTILFEKANGIIEIEKKEKAMLITRISISIILATLAYVSLQCLLHSFSVKISR